MGCVEGSCSVMNQVFIVMLMGVNGHVTDVDCHVAGVDCHVSGVGCMFLVLITITNVN